MSKFESSPVLKAFQSQLKNFQKDSQHLLCGVSGGVDSMSLLYILHRLNIQTTVVHCNYGLRGEESDSDQKMVEQVSMMWGMECISTRLDSYEAESDNFQNWARNRRYQIFRDLKSELDADYIVTAHHQDDQIETILQKILRGAGMGSWKGMDVIESDLFRPLLNCSKEMIRSFADEYEIPFREDRSNFTDDYARNFLRNEWVPKLAELFPGWRENLLKVRRRSDEFSLLADELLSQIKRRRDCIDRNKLKEIRPALYPVLILEFIKQNIPDCSVSAGFLEQITRILELETGGIIRINDDYSLIRNRDELLIHQKRVEKKREIIIDQSDLNDGEVSTGQLSISLNPWNNQLELEALQFDAECFCWPLTLSEWKDGDSIQPLGMKGSQLISDLLTNSKISSAQKKQAKVIQSFDGILCAVIFPHKDKNGRIGIISDRVKCSASTSQTVTIEKN